MRQQQDDGPVDFERLYDEEFGTTVRLARFLTGNPSVGEDIAQDAFVKVYRYLQNGTDRINDPVAFLRTATTNLCRSWHRSHVRSDLRMARHGQVNDAVTEWERELDDSLKRLPYDQRAVIVLRHWLGWSEAEIAVALNCRPGTVKSRHSRAMRTLQKELA